MRREPYITIALAIDQLERFGEVDARVENRALYPESIRDTRAREAVTTFTGRRYTQHSTGVSDGFEGFIEFFEPFVERNPERDIQVVRGIGWSRSR